MVSSRTATMSLCVTLAILLNCMAVDVQGAFSNAKYQKPYIMTNVGWLPVLYNPGAPTDSHYCLGRNHQLPSANRVETLTEGEIVTKDTCEAAGYCWHYERTLTEGLSPCFAPEPSHYALAGTSCEVPIEYRVGTQYVNGAPQCEEQGGCYRSHGTHAPYCYWARIWDKHDSDDAPTDSPYCRGITYRSWQSSQWGDDVKTKAKCEAKGYCWNSSRHLVRNQPSCFTPFADSETCKIPEEERIQAGYRNIFQHTTHRYCQSFGGCWAGEDKTPKCYHATIKPIIDERKTRKEQWRKDYQAELKRIYATGVRNQQTWRN